jgi:hypothetical protein
MFRHAKSWKQLQKEKDFEKNKFAKALIVFAFFYTYFSIVSYFLPDNF